MKVGLNILGTDEIEAQYHVDDSLQPGVTQRYGKIIYVK